MTFSHFLRAATAACVFLAALPVFAQQPMPEPTKNYAQMSRTELQADLLQITDTSDNCRTVVPLVQELLNREPALDGSLGVPFHAAKAKCAIEREAFDEALRDMKLLEDRGIDLPVNVGLSLAGRARDGEESASMLRAVLLSDDAKQLAELDPQVAWLAMRTARKAGLGNDIEEMSAEAIRAGVLENIDPDLRSSLAYNAIPFAVASEEHDFAVSLLSTVDDPTSFARLLALRKYEPIWPAVEARVGPHYRNITQAYLAKTQLAYDSDPGNLVALKDLAYALYFDGDFDGVVKLADKATNRPDLVTTLKEDEAWVLNLKAYALDAIGQRSRADEVFDLIGLGTEAAPPWRVNFAINRESRLIGQGRWEEGLAAAAIAETTAERSGTDLARSLTLRDRICALAALGRDGEMPELLAQLKEQARENPGVFAEGLLCLKRDDDAAELLKAALSDAILRDTLIEELQDEALDLFYTRSILPKPRQLLLRYPSLKAEYLKYARFIPEEFYPAASLSR